ncbi:MarR family transcriptional regulator [Frondihabitans australicus]|uniref:MarR family protein n=1 Tax=Frondihabitans australicus TaxID=386892 RepID=A0A495IFE0_9MICO|nr:MarR family transcriptional regulator [Frondihabitans australicus]RKR74654.1 MarR family protein [Frondihabitans australicus]
MESNTWLATPVVTEIGTRTLDELSALGPCRPTDLATAMTVEKAELRKHLRPLLDDELVYRIADVDDSADWLLALTPKGVRARG